MRSIIVVEVFIAVCGVRDFCSILFFRIFFKVEVYFFYRLFIVRLFCVELFAFSSVSFWVSEI